MKQLLVIMDDFGISPESDRLILEAISSGRISGVSVMINSPYLNNHIIHELIECNVDIGLHLTLCEFPFLSSERCYNNWQHFVSQNPGLFMGILSQEIEREITAQLTAFQELFSFYPMHLDSHQHIHMLPAIFNFLHHSELFQAFRIRVSYSSSPKSGFSGLVLNMMGQLGKQKGGLECIGVKDVHYLDDEKLHRELVESRSNELELLCHPYDCPFLLSDSFLSTIQSHQFELVSSKRHYVNSPA